MVWFLLEVSRESDGRVNYVHRRFSDFFSIHEPIRSTYKGNTILSLVPSPPPRMIKFFSHTSPDFVQRRKEELQVFVRKLVKVPRCATNRDFLGLLGLFPKTRETSILFGPGPLGLTLHEVGGHSVVMAFKDNKDGTKGQAEAAGKIGIGDR